MKTKTIQIVFLLTVLLIGTIAVTFTQSVAASEPNTITVPDDYLKIQDAVSAANSGDIVFVKAGTYYEDWVSLDKQVSLVGDTQKSVVYYSTAIGFIVTSNNVRVSGFTITSSEAMQGYAISISNSLDCLIENNVIKDNLVGVSISGSSAGNKVLGNILKHNQRSIELFNSPSNTISDNNITGALESGISLDLSSGNTVSGNRISDLTDGMGALMLWGSSNNIVSRNVLLGGNPMLLLGSTYNTFTENFVVDSEYGIVIGVSSNNKICSNYFINVEGMVLDTDIGEGKPSQNSWNNETKGNYWSNYAGADTDGDGIGDTAYVLYENNQDNHPLMNYPPISTNPTTDSSGSALPTEAIIVIVATVVVIVAAVVVLKLRKHK